MSPKARWMAGILLVVFPTVVFGGFSLLDLPLHDPSYASNQLRQGLWRADHAHAGVILILSVAALRYVGDAHLPERLKQVLHPFGRYSPARRILSFRSSTDATAPNRLIYLAYAGAIILALAFLVLDV